AVADDEIGSLFDESSEFGNALFRLQVEVQPGVHAGVAEMSIERAFVVELTHHLAQIAKVASQLFRSDSSVLPAFPVQWLARHVRGDSETGLANLPNAFGLLAREQPSIWRTRATLECVGERLGLRFSFFF